VRVRRLILSEKDCIGIGTFAPKDEKNQDSTELTGDINYRKIAEYSSDSDPRAFKLRRRVLRREPRHRGVHLERARQRDGEGTINPFMVLAELEKGLKHHSLITNDEEKKRYAECISMVKREYEEIVKNEVQRAISADEEAIEKLAANYIDAIKAHVLKEKVKDRFTGQDVEPDERLMRSVEEKIEIPENRKDDFRCEIMNYIGALAVDGKKFEWHTNDRLRRALELKLFEDQKDSIKLQTLVSNVIDKETQEKIDIIKTRMMKYFGYNVVSARDVLDYVASIYARGDAK
jgi:serine protein kinase